MTPLPKNAAAALTVLVLGLLTPSSIADEGATAKHSSEIQLQELAYAKPWRTTTAQGETGGKQAPSPGTVHTGDNSPLHPAVSQPDISPHHQQIADEVLRTLPASCRDALHDLFVRYEKPKHRGLSGKHVIILDGTVPDYEFRALLIHELGHITDLGCLEGTSGSLTAFRDGRDSMLSDDPSLSYYRISWESASQKRANTRPEDFVSGYAASDVFEDFAEGFVYYVLQREAFQARAKENRAVALKLRWFDRYFGSDFTVASSLSPWKEKVPWDVTKLRYEWFGGEEVAQARS